METICITMPQEEKDKSRWIFAVAYPGYKGSAGMGGD